LWHQWNDLHGKSDFYDVDAFKAGKDMLKEIEAKEVGDVKGKRMLHLQCHFRIDSLCWARRGASVVGVDFCSQSIEEAKKLNENLGLNASFVCSDIYTLKEVLKEEKEQFDIVYTSYGVIDWLPDLNEWSSVIAYFLKPKGFFYIVEFHQFMKVLDDNFERVVYSYINTEIIESDVKGSYAVPEPGISKKEYTWNHSFS
ncbi:type 12 methyltransferase-like protein, partial [Leptotrombidium deliense]